MWAAAWDRGWRQNVCWIWLLFSRLSIRYGSSEQKQLLEATSWFDLSTSECKSSGIAPSPLSICLFFCLFIFYLCFVCHSDKSQLSVSEHRDISVAFLFKNSPRLSGQHLQMCIRSPRHFQPKLIYNLTHTHTHSFFPHPLLNPAGAWNTHKHSTKRLPRQQLPQHLTQCDCFKSPVWGWLLRAANFSTFSGISQEEEGELQNENTTHTVVLLSCEKLTAYSSLTNMFSWRIFLPMS